MQKNLRAKVAPRNKTQARELANFGKAIIPFLVKSGERDSTGDLMCIYALSLIGGDEAMTALETYAGDKRRRIARMLWEIWPSFDRQRYAQHILFHFVQNQSICPAEGVSLDGIEYIPSVTRLNFTNQHRFRQLDAVAKGTHLQSLVLSHCRRIHDLIPLSTLCNLAFLDISRTSVKDIRPLAGLTKLTSLNLSGTGVEDLTPLVKLSQLLSLDLSFCHSIDDLRPLEALSQLTELALASCRRLSHVHSLAHLKKVTRIDLSGCSQLCLASLADCTHLTHLNLSSIWPPSRFMDLSPLISLSQLVSLDLSSCLWLEDLGPLAQLPSLAELDVSHCCLLDPSSLSRLIALTALNMRKCEHLDDVRPLAHLVNLRELDLSYTKVHDLSPLSSLTKLTTLRLNGCRSLGDISVLAALPHLEEVELSWASYQGSLPNYLR